ncbi:MAG: ATP-binding cassette domain-containing protein, partial [Methanobrevibacter sp.]|nr:ATP-binding cassette domain-containing protein [Methanobrevibacter sp.]
IEVIEVNHLTKDYGEHKGIFDLSLSIKKGEVYGFIGPNGAGKSTTMRHMMGFSRADNGNVTIKNLDSWQDKEKIKEFTGYLAGEIALPNDMTGLQYLKLISKMRKMQSFDYAEELLKYFKINPNAGIKKMSKGMKQKIAIVATFMHDPDIILLDEPTSGLDPLMQERFIDLVEKEKQNGKTIFLSSHIFDEVSKVCDRVGIVKEGNLIKELDMDSLRNNEEKTYIVKFKDDEDLSKMANLYDDSSIVNEKELLIKVSDSDINEFISDLSNCDLIYLKEKEESLEEYFMKFYEGDVID